MEITDIKELYMYVSNTIRMKAGTDTVHYGLKDYSKPNNGSCSLHSKCTVYVNTNTFSIILERTNSTKYLSL